MQNNKNTIKKDDVKKAKRILLLRTFFVVWGILIICKVLSSIVKNLIFMSIGLACGFAICLSCAIRYNAFDVHKKKNVKETA